MFVFNRINEQKKKLHLSHASAKTESENNRSAAQETVTELHLAVH